MHQRRKSGRLTLLTTVLLLGFASAQKVVQLAYCSVAENHLRMDCKYALPAESPEAFCKFTQGERLLDTTFPDEEQHAPFRNRAKVRLFPGNICRLLFKNLPVGKSNFTCNIKQGDSATATKTSVVEKKLLLPCSAWSVLFPSCSGLLPTLTTLPLLLEVHRL
uniref:Thy-1 cell surface antigen n=1 Tax=Kryptolebias marmoratus TaxID=37003 RepID=A0A3Q3AID8_KRYMA